MLLNGKVVLITGASRGLGAACAQSFAKRGALLALTARTQCDFPEAVITTGDITNPETRAEFVRAATERYGRIDILINNAGAGVYGHSSGTDSETARRLFDLNFFAPLALTQLVLPQMIAQRAGTIVNIASIAGQVTLPWMTLYSASKSAMISWTHGLRRELRGTGVRAMGVCPGYIRTDFHQNATGRPPAKVAGLLNRALTPHQCAEAIARGVEREASMVVTPWWGYALIALDRLAPSVVDSRLSRIGL